MLDEIRRYIGEGIKPYTNTAKENRHLEAVMDLYTRACAWQENEIPPDKLRMLREAYRGTLNALTTDGEESFRQSRSLRKVAYEIVESVVDNSVPAPHIVPRYKKDTPLINVTEEYLKFEGNHFLSKYLNDKAERSTYIDGTSWYKVWWDPTASAHDRSGDVRISVRTASQIVPQPAVTDWKRLEYIFEREYIPVSQVYQYYGRTVMADGNGSVDVITLYYINKSGVVGRFVWVPTQAIVLCDEESWLCRLVRTCNNCNTVVPVGGECPLCGGDRFKYEPATAETLKEDLVNVHNPYEDGETNDITQNQLVQEPFLKAGETIPYYQIQQLPFVPRPAVSKPNSIYGIGVVETALEAQDGINKVLTKAIDKTLTSGTVVTVPKSKHLDNSDASFKILYVNTAEEAAMVNSRPIQSDVQEELAMANILYDNAKSSSGVTDSFQGKSDYTASSGKAKQFAAMQTAGRIESMRTMKGAAFSGVYELIFKFLLAFSDETREFVRVLPDGTTKEEIWSKYMFLARDKDTGEVYYRDDFSFDCDVAATLSTNRVTMWQETTEKFIQGAFGNPSEPRVLELYWNIMEQLGYPLAKYASTGIKENAQHLPPQIEELIKNDPEIQQTIVAKIQEASANGNGGGNQPNGATHAANVERTNERNREIAKASHGANTVPQGEGGGMV